MPQSLYLTTGIVCLRVVLYACSASFFQCSVAYSFKYLASCPYLRKQVFHRAVALYPITISTKQLIILFVIPAPLHFGGLCGLLQNGVLPFGFRNHYTCLSCSLYNCFFIGTSSGDTSFMSVRLGMSVRCTKSENKPPASLSLSTTNSLAFFSISIPIHLRPGVLCRNTGRSTPAKRVKHHITCLATRLDNTVY